MDESQFARTAERANIFGRITPRQKEDLIKALLEQGHYVAMTGDGINDILALKRANLGIAMHSGTEGDSQRGRHRLARRFLWRVARGLPGGATDSQWHARHLAIVHEPHSMFGHIDRRHRLSPVAVFPSPRAKTPSSRSSP